MSYQQQVGKSTGMFGEAEKRKNSDRSWLPLWTLIFGFVLGVLMTVLLRPVSSTMTVDADGADSLYQQATAMIADATATVEALTAKATWLCLRELMTHSF